MKHPDKVIFFDGGVVTQTSFVGLDIAKAELVISVNALAPVAVANTASAITGWLASLPKDSCIAMESTGSSHLQLASKRAFACMF